MSTELKAAVPLPHPVLTEDEVKRVELALCLKIRMMTDDAIEIVDDLAGIEGGLEELGDDRGVAANSIYISFARDIRLYLELVDKVQHGWIGPNPGYIPPGLEVPKETEQRGPVTPVPLPSPGLNQKLSFGDAIAALKAGSKVCRAGWNGKGVYVFLVEADEWTFTNGVNDNLPLLPFIALVTADKTQVPWLASQTDILAEDWKILSWRHVDEPGEQT